MQQIRIAVACTFQIDDLNGQSLFIKLVRHQAKQLRIVPPAQSNLVGHFPGCT